MLLQKHVKSVHGKVKSELKLKTEYLTESKELKLEFIFDSDKEGMTEYFETDVVKSEI